MLKDNLFRKCITWIYKPFLNLKLHKISISLHWSILQSCRQVFNYHYHDDYSITLSQKLNLFCLILFPLNFLNYLFWSCPTFRLTINNRVSASFWQISSPTQILRWSSLSSLSKRKSFIFENDVFSPSLQFL